MISRLAVLFLALAPLVMAQSDLDFEELAEAKSGPTLYPRQLTAEARGLKTPGDRIQANFPVNYEGSVLAGVDTLGRVLIATDYDADGLVDISFLATAPERLEGPWSWFISNADIKYNNARLRIRSAIGDYAVNITHGDRAALGLNKKKFAEVFELLNARETVVQVTYPAGSGKALTSMSHTDLETWPYNFRYDLLDPVSVTPNCSCPQCVNIPQPRTDLTCIIGSQGECELAAGQCGTHPLTGEVLPGCGPVQCTGPGGPGPSFVYVCCSCLFFADCRCKECGVFGGP